jgi:hypothetical protein
LARRWQANQQAKSESALDAHEDQKDK